MPSTRPTRRRPALAGLSALTVLALGALGACGSTPGPSAPGAGSASGGAASGPVTVTATDTACTLSATSAPAGTVTFTVTNQGSKVNEFYVYAVGDRIVGEAENITPGLSRELKIEIAEPGTLTTACKPGMVGDGIRAPFTITGSATAAG